MASPRSFRRTLRAAYSKLINANGRTHAENLEALEDALRRVISSVPPVILEEEEREEIVVLEIDKTSVLSLPRRDRDPALVLQEINGCKSLLLEIIRRAAYDWVLYRTSTRIFHRKLAEQAYLWLFKEESGHPDDRERRESGKHITGFLAICVALDLDPKAVRQHVCRLTPKNVMSVGRPPEYRRREPVRNEEEETSTSLEPTELEDEWSSGTW